MIETRETIPVFRNQTMQAVRLIVIVLFGTVIIGYQKFSIETVRSQERLSFIEVAGFGFRDTVTGKAWIPIGVNYDHDAKGRLIEDYWHDEFSKIIEDFEKIADMGFNLVHIHLQFVRFMKDSTTINKSQLERLDQIIVLAKKLGLRLYITGLANYRKGDIPEWFLSLTDEQMVGAEVAFWRAIAARYSQEPTIAIY